MRSHNELEDVMAWMTLCSSSQRRDGRRGCFWHLLTGATPASQTDLNSSEKSPCSVVQEEKSDEGMEGSANKVAGGAIKRRG